MTLTYDPGRYRGSITSWQLGRARTGTPQLAFTVKILDRLDRQEDVPSYERTIYRAITENTIDYLIEDLRRLGYDRDTFDDLSPSSTRAFNFEGIEVEVQCTHETYDGRTREKWSFAWNSGSVQIAPLERREVSRLNAMYGARLKQHSSSSSSSSSNNNNRNNSSRPTRQTERTAGPDTEKQAEEVF